MCVFAAAIDIYLMDKNKGYYDNDHQKSLKLRADLKIKVNNQKKRYEYAKASTNKLNCIIRKNQIQDIF